jgi:hypothetical protein
MEQASSYHVTENFTNEDAPETVPDAVSEDSPLLPADLPPEIVPGKSFQYRLLAVSLAILMVLEFSQYALEPAMQEILEDIICRDQFPDHLLRAKHGSRVLDVRCKDVIVQKELAMVRSWVVATDMLVREYNADAVCLICLACWRC